MLHICHLISGDLWAGAEVMASHLLKELHKTSDISLTVILLNHGRLEEELRAEGLQIRVLDENRHSALQIAQHLRRLLMHLPPQIIHAHRYKENVLGFVASRFLPGTRLVSTQHGRPECHPGFFSLAGKAKSFINSHILKRHFDAVVSVSDDIRTFLVHDHGHSAERVRTILNGIKIPLSIPQRGCRRPFVVGSSGRLFPVKDYQLMVEVGRKLLPAEDMHFSLAGEGPERGKLEAAIREFGLTESFYLQGHLEDMEPFYQGVDLYLNTSLHEGIPLTILEAMSHGLPIIAPRVGGIPEIITDGVEGFLIEGRDPATFAEKCRLLSHDRALWDRMSAAARQKASEAFSVERMTQQYLQLYRELAFRA